jgi:hypothetical protein
MSTKEGVGETSGQTAGSSFWGSLLPFKAGPAEETGFLRSVRILKCDSQFHRSDGANARTTLSEIWS